MRSELFGSDFLSRLERLALAIREKSAGGARGVRRGRRVGSSLEFTDHRDYVAGDEFRAVDWNILGRLDRLMVKLYEEERGADLYFLVDASASMVDGVRGGMQSKFDQARVLAAALAYIGLAGQDRVGVHLFAGTLGAGLGPLHGRPAFGRCLEFLQRSEPMSGATDPEGVCREFVRLTRRRGLVVVLGDFWEVEGLDAGVRWLTSAGFEASLIHVLDPAEIEPPLRGEVTLCDAESGKETKVACTDAVLADYRRALGLHLEKVAAICTKHRCNYARIGADARFDAVVMGQLRERGIVR